MSFDLLKNRWTDPDRIGSITPQYSKETFLEIEDKIQEMSLRGPFVPRRGRINCSLNDKGKWRWFGVQFPIKN